MFNNNGESGGKAELWLLEMREVGIHVGTELGFEVIIAQLVAGEAKPWVYLFSICLKQLRSPLINFFNPFSFS